MNENIGEKSDDHKKNLKKNINNTFHHTPNNKIIIAIICDGNYKNLFVQMKNFNLFSKDWKDDDEKESVNVLYQFFKTLRESKIPFLIAFCPRFYERNSQYFYPFSKAYDEDNKKIVESLSLKKIKEENEMIKLKLSEQEITNNEQEEKIKEHEERIKNLEVSIVNLIEEFRKYKAEEEQKKLLVKKKKRAKKIDKKEK